jgi:ADP-ribose pyrophosphatase
MTNSSQEKWRVTAVTEMVDASPWLQLSKETIALPNGRIVDDYYQLRLPDFVLVYATTPDGQLILLRQYKHGVRDICLTLPGGHIEDGETPISAAKRELFEETGSCCNDWQCLGSFVNHGNLRMNVGHIFRAWNATAVASVNSGDLEDATVELYDEAEVMKLITQGAIPVMHHVAAISLANLSFGWPPVLSIPEAGDKALTG